MDNYFNVPDEHPLTQMVLGFEQDNLPHARHFADLVQTLPLADVEIDPHGADMLVYAQAIIYLTDANNAMFAKDDHGTVEAFRMLQELTETVDTSIADTMTTRHFKCFELLARIEKQCAEITLAIADHNADIAARLVRKLESFRGELVELLNPVNTGDNEKLRMIAGQLLAKMYKNGGIVHLKMASLGRNVRSANRFFERFKNLEDVLPQSVLDSPIWGPALSETHLAGRRVQGELLVEQGSYDAAIEVFEDAAFGLEDVATEIPNELPNAEVWRDHVMNYARETHARVEHCVAMSQLKRQLDEAREQHGAQEDRHADLEGFHREAMLTMARKDMGVTVNNTVDVRNFVRIRNDIAVTVQDQAMDQVLALLKQIPDCNAKKEIEKDVADAKAEKDMAAKIKKVAAVLDGAGKLIDAGAKLVPYGPVVLKALKGVFALLPERVADEDDSGPDVVEV